jgi:hypothetical protein
MANIQDSMQKAGQAVKDAFAEAANTIHEAGKDLDPRGVVPGLTSWPTQVSTYALCINYFILYFSTSKFNPLFTFR